MPVVVRSNAVHPTRDLAVLVDPWTSDEVRSAARGSRLPLSAKAVPGSDTHRKLIQAGATVYQQCPPLELDVGTGAVRTWCRDHAVLPVTDLTGLDLVELWTTWYEVVHLGWSPTAPHDQLLVLLSDMVTEIDVTRSVACEIDGLVVAAAFVFPGDPGEIVAEALVPGHPDARPAVASCMAAAIRAVTGRVRFDGHVGDPHFFPLWTTVPGVHKGAGDPLDLLEIRG